MNLFSLTIALLTVLYSTCIMAKFNVYNSARVEANKPNAPNWEFLSKTQGFQRYGTSHDWTYTGLLADVIVLGDFAYSVQGNGSSNGSAAKNTVLSLNLINGTVTQIGDLGVNYSQSNTVVEYKGRLFSIGGGTNAINYALNSVVEYDPTSHEWYQLSNAPLPRLGGEANVYRESIYYFGGWGFDTYNRAKIRLGEDGFFYSDIDENISWKQDVQRYNIADDKWEIIGHIPPDIVFTDSATVAETVYFTEMSTTSTPSAELSTFNIETSVWNKVLLPSPLFNASITRVGSDLVVYGKPDRTADNSDWRFYIYDTTTMQWSSAQSLPISSSDHQFRLAGYQDQLYYIESDASGNSNANIYRTKLNNSENNQNEYEAREAPHIVSSALANGDAISTNGSGNVINLVIDNEVDYEQIRWSADNTEQRNALRNVTQSLFEKLPDQYDFIYIIVNEDANHPNSRAYGYHVPVLNDIQGIGQGIFDFSGSYGSNERLQSIVVLPTKFDLLHGPSLHEIMHRWGNYLSSPLDSLRHQEWLGFSEEQQYHFGYLSSGGQLGGWQDIDFNLLDLPDLYFVNDAKEGLAGFSGLGPGNNSIKYSELELYLMGLIPLSEVSDMAEPASQPVETDNYPIFRIDGFDAITSQSIEENNGVRIPNSSQSPKQFNTLFVVVSQTPLSDSEWHNYEHHVQNFTQIGEDTYFRLYNFWEATEGLASLNVPDSRLYFSDYQTDTDNDGLYDFQEEELGTDINSPDTDVDGISDFDEVANSLNPLDHNDAEQDFDNDGLTNREEVLYGTNLLSEDTDNDLVSDFDEVSLGLNPLDPSDASQAPGILILFDDINNNQLPDWLRVKTTSNLTEVSLVHSHTLADVASFSLPHTLSSPTFHLLEDRNDDDIREFATFGFNTFVERYQLNVYDGVNGKSLGVWNWANTHDNVKFKPTPDFNNDGYQEYAIVGIHKVNKTRQLVVKDGATKRQYQVFKWVDNWESPRIVFMDDVTGDSVSEVALYGHHKRLNKGQLFALDGQTGAKLNVYNWNKLWSKNTLHKMSDIDGDGTADWGQFGERLDDGRYQWVVKKGSDSKGVIRTFSWPADLTNTNPLLLKDRTGDGVKEVAIYGVNDKGNVILRINDGKLSNTRIANFSWPNLWQHQSVIELGDLNKDGFNEVALLGTNKRSNATQLIIKNGNDASEYGRLSFSTTSHKVEIKSFDVNEDGYADIAIHGIEIAPLSSTISFFSGQDLSLLRKANY
tara:strand:- start:9656 stop:13375 length:3720 start_codon:yes stop_codon:yes gene_type:complete